MKDERIILQSQALRKLNKALIHIEGWGVPLKSIKDVDEYLANCRETLAEIYNFRENVRNDYLTLVMYLTMHKIDLMVEKVSLLERMHNAATSNYPYALRSYKKEISILEEWIKANKSLFK